MHGVLENIEPNHYKFIDALCPLPTLYIEMTIGFCRGSISESDWVRVEKSIAEIEYMKKAATIFLSNPLQVVIKSTFYSS